jgi:hypothetical protein
MGAAQTIIVKLRRAPRDAARQVSWIRALVGDDNIDDAHPLFPDASPGDLAKLYEVRLKNSAPVEDILASFNEAAEVEYAHVPQERSAY